MLESRTFNVFQAMFLRLRVCFIAVFLAGPVAQAQLPNPPAKPAPVEHDCVVQQSAGAGATRLLAFSGEAWAGNSYRCEVTPRLTFSLLPIPEGWRISVLESGRADELAQFSETVTGFNPLVIEAKQFLDKDGQAAASNALPAELKNREFIFSVEVGRSIIAAGKGAATPGQIEQITNDGRGTFKVVSVLLAPAEPGRKPRIVQMAFEVSMQLAGKNLEPGRRVFKVGGGVTPPKPIYAPDPEYDENARKQRIQGTVVLWLIVGPDGLPHDIKVARSLGHGLDEKAIEAVRQWKFEPSLKDGQPVAVQINVEVQFRLYRGPQ